MTIAPLGAPASCSHPSGVVTGVAASPAGAKAWVSEPLGSNVGFGACAAVCGFSWAKASVMFLPIS